MVIYDGRKLKTSLNICLTTIESVTPQQEYTNVALEKYTHRFVKGFFDGRNTFLPSSNPSTNLKTWIYRV